MSLTEGQTFAGYTIRRLLGAGGMGSVYLAAHPRLPRLDAIKVLSATLTDDAEYGPRFKREADLVSTLSHPNILGVYDRGEVDGQLWISMVYVAGTDAARLLREHYPSGMPPAVALPIVSAVASALDYAHQRSLLHRDIKPANILLESETSRIYLADFGIARPMDDSTKLTATNMAVGTVAYAAPEQLRGDPMDGRTDQYALACTAFHLLTGTTPYADSNPAVVITKHVTAPTPSLGKHRPELEGLDPVFARAMAKSPAGRYATCQEFAHALQYQIAPESVRFRSNPNLTATAPHHPTPPPAPAPQPPPLPTAPPVPAAKRTPRALIAVLSVLALLLVAGGVYAGVRLLSRESAPPAPQTPAAVVATGAAFTGVYRADYGPGTDLEGNPIPGTPETTATWNVRAACGSSGCVANASQADDGGVVLVANLTFDQVAGEWVAVTTASIQCPDPTEVWAVYTLTPQPDGTLTGETARFSPNTCGTGGKRTVTFTRTGTDVPSTVSDPSALPARTVSPAAALHGRYHEDTVYENGAFPRGGPDLQVRTYCLRDASRCISAFHAQDTMIPLIYADGKWTRNEEGLVVCAMGGTTQTKITAEYPLRDSLEDPIKVLTGHGENASVGGQCPGGKFTDKFVRTGD